MQLHKNISQVMMRAMMDLSTLPIVTPNNPGKYYPILGTNQTPNYNKSSRNTWKISQKTVCLFHHKRNAASS